MKKGFAKIAVVLDRSGSMESIRSDTIGGFNAFMDEQRKASHEVAVSLFQFDNEYETVYDFAPLNSVKPLDNKTFVPRGSTALYDAIGRSINSIGRRLSEMPEESRPERVVFLIITDGMENSSHEFRSDQIQEMIKHQREKYSWQFIFIGANQNAILSAGAIGIDAKNAMTFAATSVGTRAAYKAVSSKLVKFRASVAVGEADESLLAFDDKDRAEQQAEMKSRKSS